jgi:hypothetical protein
VPGGPNPHEVALGVLSPLRLPVPPSSVFVKFDKIRSFLDFLEHWQHAFL